MNTYKDTISGETLYVNDKVYGTFYYKDKSFTIPHRVDGPAMVWDDGRKRWFQNGKIHRMDGPAIEWKNKHNEWWIDGEGIASINGDSPLVIYKYNG